MKSLSPIVVSSRSASVRHTLLPPTPGPRTSVNSKVPCISKALLSPRPGVAGRFSTELQTRAELGAMSISKELSSFWWAQSVLLSSHLCAPLVVDQKCRR